MEIVLFLWLAGIVNSVKSGIVVGLVVSALILVISIPIMHIETNQTAYQQTWWKVTFWISICAIIFSAILPNKNTLYLMAGGYYGQKALQSDTAQKVLTIVNGHLDEQIQKLTK